MSQAELQSRLSPNQKTSFRRALLRWYDKNHRILPWRAEKHQIPNPYHVLVSEAMLQQTQVATVIDYFNRFIQSFPTIQDLASADEQQVLTLWQGLGYYRRARHLHAAAKTIVTEFNGHIPNTVKDLLSLPGVGKYTAGAIASIAHSIPAPILDGNVIRVLSRITALELSTDKPEAQAQLWDTAEHLVQGTRPGDFNQAMMELGALICTPKSPSCLTCPLRNQCAALDQSDPEKYPIITKKVKPLPVDHHILAIKRDDKFLIQQRPDTGLWSAMWQLPTLELEPKQKVTKSKTSRNKTTQNSHNLLDMESTLTEYSQSKLGLSIKSLHNTHIFKHQTTHRTIHFHLWTASISKGRLKPKVAHWQSLEKLEEFPFSNPQRKAIKHLLK